MRRYKKFIRVSKILKSNMDKLWVNTTTVSNEPYTGTTSNDAVTLLRIATDNVTTGTNVGMITCSWGLRFRTLIV